MMLCDLRQTKEAAAMSIPSHQSVSRASTWKSTPRIASSHATLITSWRRSFVAHVSFLKAADPIKDFDGWTNWPGKANTPMFARRPLSI